MQSRNTRYLAAFVAAFGWVAVAGPASARDWVTTGWVHVPVRAYASAAAPVVDQIPGGDRVDLTGQCTRDLDLAVIAYMHPGRQRAIVKTRWCELAGPVHGWIFGGFLKPF